jgi:hypothetical protein
VIGSFLRGLSTRDVEALLEESFGERPRHVPVSAGTSRRTSQPTRSHPPRSCEPTGACSLARVILNL